MTNLLFQRIQFSGITPDNHQKKRAEQKLTRFLVAFIGALLILLAVGAALFAGTGQGSRQANPTSQGHSKPAPLDLFP